MAQQFEPTSLTLLERVRSKDEQAWHRLVDLYAPLVHYWCRKGKLSSEDTADVFQEVFRAVAEHIDRFRHEKPNDTFRGWLKVITGNKIRDHYRRQAGKPAAQGGTVAQQLIAAAADPLANSDESDEVGILQQQLRRALDWIRDDFEERTWQAFWKLQIDELPSDEVAEELGMTPAAVRKAKYRVLQRLREELEGLIDG